MIPIPCTTTSHTATYDKTSRYIRNMGNGAVSRKGVEGCDLIGLLMPSYYVAQEEISPLDVDNVQTSWCTILNQEGVQYRKMQEVRRVSQDHSCLTWFYNIFFHRVRLLSIHCPTETTQKAFSNSKFFLNIIRCVLCVHEQDSKFLISTQSLFGTMDTYSITFCDMCMIGGVLFTALQECLGVEFTSDVKHSWVKLYSALLRDIAHELTHRATKSSRKDNEPINAEELE